MATLTPPPVPERTYLGLIWGGIGVSLFFVISRVVARLRTIGKLYVHDYLLIVAWVLVLGVGIVLQVIADDLYDYLEVGSGQAPIPADLTGFMNSVTKYFHGELISLFFFYTSLYSVKLSFMLFFRHLGKHVNSQKYIWWPVLAFQILAYCTLIALLPFPCLVNGFLYALNYCTSGYWFRAPGIQNKVVTAVDIVGDFLIMILPTTLLWNVRMVWTRKLAIFGIFSLVIVTMIFSIVRAVMIDANDTPNDVYLWMWSTLEANVAIIVASLSAFPQLFTQAGNQNRPYKPSDTYLQRMYKRSGQSSTRKKEASMYNISRVDEENFEYVRAPDVEAGRFNNYPPSMDSDQPSRLPAAMLHGEKDLHDRRELIAGSAR